MTWRTVCESNTHSRVLGSHPKLLAVHLKQSFLPVRMGGNGNAARIQHRLNNFNGRLAGHVTTIAGGPPAANRSEKFADPLGRSRRIENGEKVETSIDGDFHSGETGVSSRKSSGGVPSFACRCILS